MGAGEAGQLLRRKSLARPFTFVVVRVVPIERAEQVEQPLPLPPRYAFPPRSVPDRRFAANFQCLVEKFPAYKWNF